MSDFYIAVNADPAHIDSINVNDVTTYIILDGTLDLSTPGVIRWQQRIAGADANERIDAANALFRLIRRASQAESIGSSITFSMRRGGSEFSHFDLTGMSDPERNVRVLPGGASAVYDLELSCYPYPRGDAMPVTVAGTLAGSTAAFLVTDIPGHIDALAHLELTDTSGSGVINRVRASVIRGDFDAASDYTPWVDANALTGATDTPDVGNSYGDDYATRTLTSTSFVDIARGVQPAGARQQGRMDGYARVYSTGTAIGAGANLNGTVNAPDAITTTDSNYAVITLGQTGSGRTTVGTNPSATWSGTTTAGSLLLIVLYSQAGSVSPTLPGGYKRLLPAAGVSITSEAGNEMYVHIYYQRNAAATSGSVTVDDGTTATVGNPSSVQLLELLNADAITMYESASSATNTDEPTGAVPSDSTFTNEYVLSLFTLPTANTTDPTDFWYAGYEAVFGANSMLAGAQIVDSRGTTPPTPQVRLDATYDAWMNLNLHIKPVKTESSVTTYQEPTPGELETGTYTARVQAIDATGKSQYRGNASASATDSVTTARSSIDYTWDAVTNATAYALTIQYGSRYYEVVTTDTSYELESLAGLKDVSALPATSGAIAPPPYIRARAGTVNDHSLTKLKPDEVRLSGSGAFEMVRLFSNQMLPPIDAPLSDTRPDYAVEVQGRSANGANATVRVDALWIVPCREPQVEAWIQGLAHGTARRWLIESHRSGKGAFGWLESTSTGDEVGRLTTAGSLLIPPGTSIVLLEFEQAAGVHTFAASVTASLRIFPRFRWEATL